MCLKSQERQTSDHQKRLLLSPAIPTPLLCHHGTAMPTLPMQQKVADALGSYLSHLTESCERRPGNRWALLPLLAEKGSLFLLHPITGPRAHPGPRPIHTPQPLMLVVLLRRIRRHRDGPSFDDPQRRTRRRTNSRSAAWMVRGNSPRRTPR